MIFTTFECEYNYEYDFSMLDKTNTQCCSGDRETTDAIATNARLDLIDLLPSMLTSLSPFYSKYSDSSSPEVTPTPDCAR